MFFPIYGLAAFLSFSNDGKDGRLRPYCSGLRTHNKHTSNESTSNREIVVSESRTSSFMLYWPSITTFTLVDGWKDDIMDELQSAVKEVVDMNPILSGRVTKSAWPRNKITVRTGAYPSKSHEFVKKIDFSSTEKKIPNIRTLNQIQLVRFMDDFISPRVSKSHSVLEVRQVTILSSLVFYVQLSDIILLHYDISSFRMETLYLVCHLFSI